MRYLDEKNYRWLIEQRSPHRGFGYMLSESDDGVFLEVSLEEFAKYSGPQQEDLAVWMGHLCNSLRQRGIPCYIIRKEDKRSNN